eukprot:12886704-Prorocentrum_lima.AAC.1
MPFKPALRKIRISFFTNLAVATALKMQVADSSLSLSQASYNACTWPPLSESDTKQSRRHRHLPRGCGAS